MEVNLTPQYSRVTPDGTYLMLMSKLPLNPVADSDTDLDAYRWGEEDGWRCVSCQPPGVPSAGFANSSPIATIGSTALFAHDRMPRITDDGRIFFDTPDALVPGDINGVGGCPAIPIAYTGLALFGYQCTDVYEWNEGKVSLITTGTGTEPSMLLSATADGKNVFFETANRLVGWDVDLGVDIYTARVGGGFPEPPPQPPACEGEGCREESSEASDIAGAGSAVFQGPGNPRAEAPQGNRCAAGKLRRGKRCLTVAAIARKRCRRLDGPAKRRCIRAQTRRLRRAKRKANRRQRARARKADYHRRAGR